MRSSNPTLNDKTYEGLQATGLPMTINGTITRALILLVLVVVSGAFTWDKIKLGDIADAYQWALAGLIGGLVFCLVTVFKKEWSPVTAPIYAICEGLLLGAVSALMEARFKGIVVDAVLLTFGTLFCLLLAYRSGLIKATRNFVLGITAATGAICLVYLVGWIMAMFGKSIPYIHEGGWVGIGFSLFVVTIAALNLVIDFDLIERGEAVGAPKYMEWYGAFALMVTLIWLYLEILRLLSKLRNR